MFYATQLGNSDLSDYKNLKGYSYYKCGWLQPLYFHRLSGSKYYILKKECRHSQRKNEINHKVWIIMKKFGKIRSCHRTFYIVHAAAAMYKIEVAVRNGLTNPSCISTAK